MNIAGTPTVSGKNITLSTTGGAIGAVTSMVNNTDPDQHPAAGAAGDADDASQRRTRRRRRQCGRDHGGLSVQKNGDMRVGTVSSNGAVFLMAAGQNGQPANSSTASRGRRAPPRRRGLPTCGLTSTSSTMRDCGGQRLRERREPQLPGISPVHADDDADSGVAADRNAALSVIKAQDAAATGERRVNFRYGCARAMRRPRHHPDEPSRGAGLDVQPEQPDDSLGDAGADRRDPGPRYDVPLRCRPTRPSTGPSPAARSGR